MNLINRDERRLQPHFSLVAIELVLGVLLVLCLADGGVHYPPQEEVGVVRGPLASEVEEPGLPHHELVDLGVEVRLRDAPVRLGHQGKDDNLSAKLARAAATAAEERERPIGDWSKEY